MAITRSILTLASAAVAIAILSPKLFLLAGALSLLAVYVAVPVVVIGGIAKLLVR